MALGVLDPTAARAAGAAVLAPPLATLAGTTVALLDNGKVNVDRFLDELEAVLRVDHGVRDVVRRRKPNVSAPVPAGILADLVACDAVVSAVGD